MTNAPTKARRATYFTPVAEAIRTFGEVAFTELSPCTEPAVIAARHREEVSDAYHVRGLESPEEISESLMLPVSIVIRHLEALVLRELQPAEVRARLAAGQVPELAAEVLAKADRPLSGKEIAERTGASYASVYSALTNRPDLFVPMQAGWFRGKARFDWRLKAT